MGKEVDPTPRQRALQLASRKEAIEAEMEAILSQLSANNGPGLSDRLVDAEGFPRADVDVVQIRTLRNRFAVLKTDLAAVDADMERALHLALAPRARDPAADAPQPASAAPRASAAVPPRPAASAASAASAPTPAPAANGAPAPDGAAVAEPSPGDTAGDTTEQPSAPRRPAFAVVDMVFPSSPAAAAGLRVDDRLLSVGGVELGRYATPRDALAALPGLLRSHEGRAVRVSIERGDAPAVHALALSLTPRRWPGQGLLGCHVVPVHAPQVDPAYQPDVATAAALRAGANRSVSSLR